VQATCQGKIYECGDCVDNDNDGKTDMNDVGCLGPCDNTETDLTLGIPGGNSAPCKADCYFDQDTGSGNDDCYWSHKCDPLEVAPAYPPEGSQCSYNPNANIPGYNGTCNTAFNVQSAACLDYCGPLTPNGCDCFGCCAIPGAPTTVWLGSSSGGTGTCTLDNVGNPSLCKPCTQVQACLNTCGNCEICIGKPEPGPECDPGGNGGGGAGAGGNGSGGSSGGDQCAPGVQPCGLPGQEPCPFGQYCITGCCIAEPPS
jgi:hypothetical protein